MSNWKQIIKLIPIIGPALVKWNQQRQNRSINSQDYWRSRYELGGDSGAGSYNRLAEFKAKVINDFVVEHDITRVIEFGSGDGNQLKYFQFREYLGYDISEKAVELCRDYYKNDSTKSFSLLGQSDVDKAELTLSLDVIYHLLEDEVFNNYMKTLFNSSTRFVVIYSSNMEDKGGSSAHVKHRKFTEWVSSYEPSFEMVKHIPNAYPHNGDDSVTSFADFYIYRRLT